MPKVLSDLLAAIGETDSPSVNAGGPAVLGDLLSAIGETPAETERFYRETLGLSFTGDEREAAQRIVQPQEGKVFFADFENVLLQALFSMPENWGLTLAELEALRDEE